MPAGYPSEIVFSIVAPAPLDIQNFQFPLPSSHARYVMVFQSVWLLTEPTESVARLYSKGTCTPLFAPRESKSG